MKVTMTRTAERYALSEDIRAVRDALTVAQIRAAVLYGWPSAAPEDELDRTEFGRVLLADPTTEMMGPSWLITDKFRPEVKNI